MLLNRRYTDEAKLGRAFAPFKKTDVTGRLAQPAVQCYWGAPNASPSVITPPKVEGEHTCVTQHAGSPKRSLKYHGQRLVLQYHE